VKAPDRWVLSAARDYAAITSSPDVTAPAGTALVFDHQRTRTSSASQEIALEPNSLYLFSTWVKAEKYLRTGMGLRLVISADGRVAENRFPESQLSEEWQPQYLAFATGQTGRATLTIMVHATVGRVSLAAIQMAKTTRPEARARLGSVPSIPFAPVRPNEAEARLIPERLYVSPRMPSYSTVQIRDALGPELMKAKGRLVIELPETVTITGYKGTPEKAGALTRYSFAGPDIQFYYNAGWVHFYAVSRLAPGATAKGRYWAEWPGGAQKPVDLDVVAVSVPSVPQPKTLATGISIYEETMTGYPDTCGMLKSLGFNMIDFWKRGQGGKHLKALQAHGLEVDTEYSGFCEIARLVKSTKDAHSLNYTGQERDDVLDASHRGKLFEQFLVDMQDLAAAGFSAVMFDDEHYSDWASINTCACERCRQRWVEWLARNRPELPPVKPEVFLDDPLAYLEQYNAWFFFRADLVKEWYQAGWEEFVKAVKKYQGKSTAVPKFFSYTGPAGFDSVKESFMNPAAMAGLFDRIMPMFYEDGFALRRHIRELVDAVGREHAYAALCTGEPGSSRFEWQPGEHRAMMLETLFGGARGYMFWTWPNASLLTIAEIAETNGVVAANETMLLKGKFSRRFWLDGDNPRRFVTCLENDREGLMLVSNYARSGEPDIWIRKRPGEKYRLTELFDGGKLEAGAGQQLFCVSVPAGTVGLWKWRIP